MPPIPGLDSRQVQTLLARSPMLQNLVKALAVQPGNVALRSAVQIQLAAARAQVAANPFALHEPPPETILYEPGDVEVLKLAPPWHLLGLNPNRTPCSIMLIGPAGSGKSTETFRLVADMGERGFLVIIYDRQNQFRRLLRHPRLAGLVTVLRAEQLQIPLYQCISGVDLSDIVFSTSDHLGRCLGRIYSQRPLAEVALRLLGSDGDGVPLPELLQGLEQEVRRRGFRIQQLLQSILGSMSYVNASKLGAAFDYRRSNFLQKMTEQPGIYVIECAGFPEDLYQLLAVIVQDWHAQYRLHRPVGSYPVMMSVLDDATGTVNAEWDRQSIGGISALAEHLIMNRKLDMGLLVDTHAASCTSEIIARNCETRILLSARGEQAHVITPIMNLTPEQLDVARALRPGQAIALVPSKYPWPLLGTFAPIALQDVDDAACLASAQRFLSRVHGIRREHSTTILVAPAAVHAGGGAPDSSSVARRTYDVDPRTLRLLIDLARDLPLPLSIVYMKHALTRQTGARLIGHLRDEGLIRRHEYATAQRGGAVAIAEITDAGWTILERKQVAVRARAPVAGSFDHVLAARLSAAIGTACGFGDVAYEVNLRVVRPDIRLRRRSDSKEIFGQCGVSDPRREADALIRAWTVPAIQAGRLVLVARDQAFVRRVLSLIDELDGKRQRVPALSTRLIGQLLMSWAEIAAGKTGRIEMLVDVQANAMSSDGTPDTADDDSDADSGEVEDSGDDVG